MAGRIAGALLDVPVGAPVLAVTRVTYPRDEQPLAAATVISRADRYAYQVKGRPGRAPETNRKKTGRVYLPHPRVRSRLEVHE